MTLHVILIHGAWAGPWVWNTIAPHLSEAGHRPHAVTLPGVGEPTGTDIEVTLETLADLVVDHIATLDGPIVLVGHSGGGIIATEVAERLPDRVVGVAFVAGMMLPSATTYAALCAGMGFEQLPGVAPYLQNVDDDRATVVPPDVAVSIFFNAAAPDTAISAARRLRPQLESARRIAPTWSPERFGSIPRLYIEALGDRSLSIRTQRRMQELTPGATVVSLDCDHAPQLSAPQELASALIEFCQIVHPTTPLDRTENNQLSTEPRTTT